MKKQSRIALAAATAFVAVTFATAALTQTAKKPAPAKPAKPSAYQDQGFTPGFDDLMTMLVQPRHIKLYYAGMAKNWELAAAEARDLRSSFGRVAETVPKYEGNDVAAAMGNFAAPKLDAIDAAIAAGNPDQFATAYKTLTTGCNECHTYMEHPFLVIKIPDVAGAAAPDQDFKSAPN